MLSWGSETNMFALCITRLLFHHHCFCSMEEEEEEGKKVEKRERGLRKVFPTEEILLKSIFKTWVFFGEKRRVHHLIEKVTNTYENHFSRSKYEESLCADIVNRYHRILLVTIKRNAELYIMWLCSIQWTQFCLTSLNICLNIPLQSKAKFKKICVRLIC